MECDAFKGLEIKYLQIYRSTYFLLFSNTNMLPCKPKISYRYLKLLKLGIQEFNTKYVLVPADKLQTTLLLFDGYTILTL